MPVTVDGFPLEADGNTSYASLVAPADGTITIYVDYNLKATMNDIDHLKVSGGSLHGYLNGALAYGKADGSFTEKNFRWDQDIAVKRGDSTTILAIRANNHADPTSWVVRLIFKDA